MRKPIDLEGEIELTMDSYRRDPVIPSDPALADRIIGRHRVSAPAVRRWAEEFRLGEATVALTVIVNIITMIYVLSANGPGTEGRDALQQLRTEYDIEFMNVNGTEGP